MDLANAIPSALILHDGELGDIRPLLDAMGAPSVERCGGVLPGDAERRWDLVVATPRRLLELTSGVGQSAGRVRVAVATGDSRTLRTLLQRANADFLVRRPVDPATLRNLLLRALYLGPEKRRSPRWSAGTPVRFRSGLRVRLGLLVDLSLTGCQVVSTDPAELGQNLTVYVPDRSGAAKPLSVRGAVVRTRLAGGAEAGKHAIHIEFGEMSSKLGSRLTQIVDSYRDGPAAVPGHFTDASPAPLQVPAAAQAAAGETEPPASDPACDTGDDSGDGRERRSDPRLELSSRIIVLGSEEARVLSARDISTGGLRAEMHPNVSVGDELQIAVRLPGARAPLVVKARVVRNEEEPGMALSFQDLPDEARSYLERSLKLLPPAETTFGDDEQPAHVIVSEILANASE